MRRLDLTEVGPLDLASRGPEEPARECVRLLDSWQISKLNSAIISIVGAPATAEAALRVSVLRRLTPSSADAFTIDTWIASTGNFPTTVLARSWWDAQLFRGYLDPKVGVIRIPNPLKTVAARIAERLQRKQRWPRRRSQSSTRPALDNSFIDQLPGVSVTGRQVAARPDASVAMFLPKGLSYSASYSYDFWISRDAGSPISNENLAFFSSQPTADPLGKACIPYPETKTGLNTLVLGTKLLFKMRPWTLLRIRKHIVFNQCATAARAQRLAGVFERLVPNATLAVLSYEMQVPTDLVLGLKMCGIRTAAVNERPAIAFRSIMPFAVDLLLTAGPAYSKAVRDSGALSVSSTKEVGLWRTDLVFEARRRPRPTIMENSSRNSRSTVLVLPFDVATREDPAGYPLVTGVAGVNYFLDSIRKLANLMRETTFVIRSKSNNWMWEPDCAEMATCLSDLPNVIADTDFSTQGRSYALAAYSDAVVARPTSLVDELLAVGTPCVIHDFSRNAKNIARSSYPYLPRMIWAESQAELECRLQSHLAEGGEAFRAKWEPHRQELFGDLCDGNVRGRVREVFESLARPPLG